ncbi:endonuclease III [Candidatus Xianfuyuplasma coldseepsis]|uniref:Endonuclease III n=1 Tax=Candidatus Xianfuyuplasma coldseepsis TaxID=2782163 RepID=A0A7L7KRY7_9MOLU|nr:endonuclease III [Xianfuyuplasma coldseepsis]QMS85590.1 endonuclease III [Xianfuyuplasma coldseepsis]
MDRVKTILHVLNEMFPNAQCELVHNNGFELLIAVMLSAQTTDKSVNLLTDSLFKKYHTPQDFLQVPLEELEQDLRRIGLYKNKAKNIQKMCQILLDQFDGEVPSSQVELETLPGVGRKTANVVLSVWFGVPRIAVDTHVERVSKRLKLAYLNDNVHQVEEKLMRKIPRDKWSDTHHKMIFFGRYHCTARNPKCDECPLQDLCRYPNINVRKNG